MSDNLHIDQVLTYDAAPLLARLHARGKIKPFERRQDISVDDVLPSQPAGFCACGCGGVVRPPRRKWAADGCSWFGYAVQGILLGDMRTVRNYLIRQLNRQGLRIGCEQCGTTSAALEVDHKLAVKLGGGGMWLDNYQLLCPACHLLKTNNDRKLISAHRKALANAI